MAEKTKLTEKEEIAMSKRAYVRGFANTLQQEGTEPEVITSMAKQATTRREALVEPETAERLEKRASDISAVILETADAKKED